MPGYLRASVFQSVSVVAMRTCSAVTTGHFSPTAASMRAAGEDAGSPEDPSRALVERRDGVVGEELGLSAGDGEMMGDIGGHVIVIVPLDFS